MSDENENIEADNETPAWTEQEGAERFGGDVNKLWDSYREMEKFKGSSIRVPSENASDEERNEFYQSLVDKAPGVMPKPDFDNLEENTTFFRSIGMPEKPDGYQAIEGVEPEVAKPLYELFHTANLTQHQADILSNAFAEDAKQQSILAQENAEQGAQALKDEWGLAADDNIKLAAQFADKAGAPDEVKQMMANPEVMKWMHSLASKMGEGAELAGQENSPQAAMTPAEAQAQLDEIDRNPEHPYRNPAHPSHAQWAGVEGRYVKLMRYANPKSSTDTNLRTSFSSGA